MIGKTGIKGCGITKVSRKGVCAMTGKEAEQ